MTRDELIVAMLVEYCAGHDETEDGKTAMNRALSVAVEEMLGEPTKDETKRRWGKDGAPGSGSSWDAATHTCYADMLAARRARFTKPEPIPDAVRNLFISQQNDHTREFNERIMDAYRIGLKERTQ
jgi:hypothetical protein